MLELDQVWGELSLTNASLVSLCSSSTLSGFCQFGCCFTEAITVQVDILIHIGSNGLTGWSDFCLCSSFCFSLSKTFFECATEARLGDVNATFERGDRSVSLRGRLVLQV